METPNYEVTAFVSTTVYIKYEKKINMNLVPLKRSDYYLTLKTQRYPV